LEHRLVRRPLWGSLKRNSRHTNRLDRYRHINRGAVVVGVRIRWRPHLRLALTVIDIK
jgi:hypothetical protein